MTLEFSRPKNAKIPNLIQSRPEGAEFFHADGRTDMRKMTVVFRNFANAPKRKGSNPQYQQTPSQRHAPSQFAHSDRNPHWILVHSVPRQPVHMRSSTRYVSAVYGKISHCHVKYQSGLPLVLQGGSCDKTARLIWCSNAVVTIFTVSMFSLN
jgi:hypothetical protein